MTDVFPIPSLAQCLLERASASAETQVNETDTALVLLLLCCHQSAKVKGQLETASLVGLEWKGGRERITPRGKGTALAPKHDPEQNDMSYWASFSSVE